MTMKDGVRVTLTDNRGLNHGTVMKRYEDGLCTVKWDNGVAERCHESELKLETPHPSQVTVTGDQMVTGLQDEIGADELDWENATVQKGLEEAVRGETVPMPDLGDDDSAHDLSGYPGADPKSPGWRERLASLWDSRPGK